MYLHTLTKIVDAIQMKENRITDPVSIYICYTLNMHELYKKKIAFVAKVFDFSWNKKRAHSVIQWKL